MPKYLLILRGDPDAWRHAGPEQIQKVIEHFESWAGKLMAQGRFVDGKKLADGHGRVIERRSGKAVVTDGPYGETKEIVGGFHLISADNYEHAVELCRDHPELGLAGTVEIRELDSMGRPES
jgi:hypothetical protein